MIKCLKFELILEEFVLYPKERIRITCEENLWGGGGLKNINISE